MKKLLSILLVVTTAVIACSKFDDSSIQNRLTSLEGRVSSLELLCSQMNTNIGSLQSAIIALQSNDCVVGVDSVKQEGKVVGYVIRFKKSPSITIYNGKDGADGQDGEDGKTPAIGVRKGTDDVYYWSLNGEWLLDAQGNKIKAVGTDGKNGTNGKEGITPKLKIEEGYWFVSIDNGATWSNLGKATGEDGKGGVFDSVAFDGNFVLLTLRDGETVLKIRRENSDSFKRDTPLENEIFYTTSDKKIAKVSIDFVFSECGTYAVSNKYDTTANKGVITFNDAVYGIPSEFFCNASTLTSVLQYKTSHVGRKAFYGCSNLISVKSIALDDSSSDASIGEYAFYQCAQLTDFTISESVKEIGDWAFYGCGLKEITIPQNVSSIGNYALQYAASTIVFKGVTPPAVQYETFSAESWNEKVVPAASYSLYKDAFSSTNRGSGNLFADDSQIQFVDLGLSVKWANCNIGAATPDVSGRDFAWGEINGKGTFTWKNYRYCNGTQYIMTKYNTTSEYGSIDNKTMLEEEDDRAYLSLGNKVHTPTKEEWAELKNENNCSWVFDNYNSTAGWYVYSKKIGYTDKFIFLPVPPEQGLFQNEYMSSSLVATSPSKCYYTCLTNSEIRICDGTRSDSFKVRAVQIK